MIVGVQSTAVLRLAVLSLAIGCTTPIGDEVCPDLGSGDLVVTEIRGDQSGVYGQFIEIHNAAGGARDLRGLHVRLRSVTGSDDDTILVRRSLVVEAGAAVVLGAFPADGLPAHVDYGWQPDYLSDSGTPKALPDSGDVRLEACGLLIDRVVWTDLPDVGTYSLGLTPPDATGNDTAANWCTDAVDDDLNTPGAPGTPGEANRPCP